MDEAWSGLLKTLVSANAPGPAGVAIEEDEGEGEFASTEAWIARASALALCARDAGEGSNTAMSR